MKKIFLFCFLLLGLSAPLVAQVYTTTPLITGLSNPVAFDIAPDGRFFLTQKGGVSLPTTNAQIKVYSAAGSYIGIFYDLSDSVNCDFERGLLGITFDPNFTTNHWVYVYYNYNDDSQNGNGDERIRITRFTEVNNVGTQPTNIFDLDVSNSIPGNHVGGNLHFMNNDTTHLFFTIGDLAYQQGNPTLNYANKLTNPYGKHLRINKDGSIPTDNPFYDDGNPLATNCDWIWSYGHRNPFDFCFSPVTDSLYSSENGWNAWDEMNQVTRGKFYGWADCEGNFLNSSTSNPCNAPNAVLPIEDWGTPLPAVTGILYYSSQVMPEFDNHILIADNDYGRIYNITLGNPPAYDQFVSRVQWMDVVSETGGLTTIKQGADGCVYAMKGGYTSNGKIYSICPQNLAINTPSTDATALHLAPNPVDNQSVLSYQLADNGTVTVRVVDLSGREVAVVFTGTQAAGKQQLTIDAKALNLAVGTYFITVNTLDSQRATKLVITN
jgi:glucose/arabinose dehydrogenase